MLKSARIAVFVSGGGTNLQALLDAQRDGKIPHGEIALVISSQACAYALERAEKANVPAHTVPSSLIQHDFEAAIELLLEQYKIDVIVLAGFLSIHIFSFLSVMSVKIAAKPCKHGTLPDDRLRLFCKTVKPTAVGDSLKSPALRGFVGGPHA